eukprot:1006348-Prymnesium_polylepis.1
MWPLEVGVLQGGWVEQQQQQRRNTPATAAAAAAAAEGARAIRRCARAASVCWPGACARACGDQNHSPGQQPQRMPLASRSKQLSNVLDPA